MLKITFHLTSAADKVIARYLPFKGDANEASLETLRPLVSFVTAGDRFVDPTGTFAIDVDDEAAFLLTEWSGAVASPKPAEGSSKPAEGAKPAEGSAKPAEGGAKPAEGGATPAAGAATSAAGGATPAAGSVKPIVVWTAAYLAAREVPALQPRVHQPVQLHVTRKPEGLGGRDKVYSTTQRELETMTLADLRTALVGKGWIHETDVFVEQGAPRKVEDEASLAVKDVASREAKAPISKDDKAPAGKDDKALTIEVYSKAEAAKTVENDKWKDYKPAIKAADFKVELKKPELKDYTFTGDKTASLGEGFGSIAVPIKAGEARTLSELTSKEQEQLLQNCRLYPRQGDTSTCAALRMDDRIEFSGANTIVCKQIQLLPSNTMREDRVSVSYSEEISKWQSYLVEASKLGAAVPLTFDAAAGGGHTQVDEEFAKGVTIHLSKVLVLPKAEAILEGVELSPLFVEAVTKAVASGSGYALMQVLQKYGHFVATHFVLGGKLECTSSTVLTETCKRSELGWSFNVQASGAFKAQGVPVELGAGTSVESNQKHEGITINQRYNLDVRTIGGSGEGSSSKTDKLADNWLITVATQPQTWRVIGFKDDVIKPTLEYLEDATLKQQAKTLLRQYFESQLVLRKSAAVGGSGGKDWDEREHATFGNKVAGCNIMFDQNIDSIRFDYENRETNAKTSGQWHGDSRETEHPFTVGSKDEIVGIEVGWDNTIDHVLIHTKNDDNMGNVTGRSKGAVHTHLFQEPRIRGFHGRAGHFLDALGVYYYDLPKDLNGVHRSALLALERYLFA